jgi:hypothetical protein
MPMIFLSNEEGLYGIILATSWVIFLILFTIAYLPYIWEIFIHLQASNYSFFRKIVTGIILFILVGLGIQAVLR